ncbi:MAG: FtsX-like permease family protein [Acidimicrobiales bacterium]
MLRVTLRNIWAHKRRLVSTVVAILLGVAFMSGTLVLTDTLDRAFDDIFQTGSEGIDAEVRGEDLFESDFAGTSRARLDASLLADVRDVDGVRVAAGYISTEQVAVLGAKGESIGSNQGPPTWVENWIDDPDLNAFRVVDGRAPEADNEVVINRAAVEDGDLQVGDEVTVMYAEAREQLTLVGITTFADEDSAGGTTAVSSTLATAQRIAAAADEFDLIYAAAAEGVSQEQLVRRIAPSLPEGPEVVTGEQSADEAAEALQSGFAFFRQILLVFAGIALFVGTFIIINTFSILVAQRTREMALLRAIGAGRRQVLVSVLFEALLIGLVAAVVGLLAGIGLAIVVQAGLDALGVDLPTTSTVIEPATILTALIVGVVVTVLSAVAPALKATRVRPLAALRDLALDETGASRRRLILGVVLIVIGLFSLSPALGDDPSTDVVPGVGLGALAVLIGVIVIGPILVKPLAGTIGAFLPRLKGTTGKLARQNAIRSPRRTASTAGALMIGVALVAFITVFGASATASVEKEVARGFTGDVVVQGSSGFSLLGVSRQFTRDLGEIDGVEVVGAMQLGPGRVALPDGDTTDPLFGALDPADFGEVFSVRMEEGDLTDLGPGGVMIDRRVADDKALAVGDQVTITGATGQTDDFTVDAISDDLAMLSSDWILTTEDFLRLSPETLDAFMGVTLSDGADLDTVMQDIEALAEDYPAVAVQDREEFIGSLASQITALLNVIYGLLALSIIIALIGIGNTLSLSIHERTRELGLLRAVGMSRAQVRSSIRWEALIVALMGTALGLLLGLGLAFVMVKALAGFGLGTFDLPLGGVLTVVILGIVVAVVASFRPSRRAAGLDVLEAIGSE